MLPNFIIAGAARSGTTSLSNYLGYHPEVNMSKFKEPHFFAFEGSDHQFDGPFDDLINHRIVRDIDDYHALFNNDKSETAIGEASPGYLFFPKTAENIKSKIPECKIIIILRNPVERAFSHHRQHVMIKHENLEFANAIHEEDKRKDANWRWFYQYKNQGFYFHQVKNYLDIFGEDQVKIVLFDDLIDSPSSILKDISLFLNIDPKFYSDFEFEAKYKSGTPKIEVIDTLMRGQGIFKGVIRAIISQENRRKFYKFLKRKNYDYSKKTMPKNISIQLENEFKEDVIKLQELINRDLSEWSSLKNTKKE